MLNNNLKSQFLLRKDITHLNFGAFGACPRPVLERCHQIQEEVEEDPTHFVLEKLPGYLKEARIALSYFLTCDPDDVVYVTNPSYGVNIVAKSLQLDHGDEVLATDLEYGACDRTWEYYCRQKGAVYMRQKIRFPIESTEDFISQFLEGITPRTKLIFISHITSSTGLRLPVHEICRIAKEKGLSTFIDGAHAPGQIEVNLANLDADFYTGACHKWMLAPKGSSFLYVKKEFQNLLDPLLISWGYNSDKPSGSRFLDYHQLQGTKDYSASLSVPAAINFMKENNWDDVRAACKTITQNNATRFCKLLGATPLCPVTDDFIAQLYSINLNIDAPEKLHDTLYRKYNIQVPVMPHNNKWYLRYSINAFNSNIDLDKLYDALEEIVTK
jgi:isopenicillin-N epimerase